MQLGKQLSKLISSRELREGSILLDSASHCSADLDDDVTTVLARLLAHLPDTKED